MLIKEITVNDITFAGTSHPSMIPVDTGRKLNVYKTLIKLPGRLLNVLCTLHLRPVTMGLLQTLFLWY